jgi:hypothetical protein
LERLARPSVRAGAPYLFETHKPTRIAAVLELRASPAVTSLGKQLERMSIWICEVDRSAWDPRMENWARNVNALFSEQGGRPIQLRVRYCESKMLMLRFPAIFLQHHHSRGVAGTQEEPVPALIKQAELKTQDLTIESFGGLQISDLYRHLI